MSKQIQRCVCGAELRDLNAEVMEDTPEDERWPMWTHVPGSDTRCTNPRRVADVFPDRALIVAVTEQMADLGDRTRRAAGEFERFQSMLAELIDESRGLTASLDMPGTVERATLNRVWDKLVDKGHLAAAQVVSEMLRNLR